MDLNWFLRFIVFVIFLDNSWSCRCSKKHPQADFCQHSFVIRGVVKEVDKKHESVPYLNNAVSYTYAIQVEEIYKFVFGFTLDTEVYKFNGGDPALCGLILERDKKYLLAGVYWRNSFHLSNCDWISEFETLTKAQFDGIRGAYDCKCMVKDISEYTNNALQNQYTCYVPRGDEVCMATRGQCQLVNYQCQWRVFQYDQCRKQHRQPASFLRE